MDDAERDRVIHTVEQTFLYVGAGDCWFPGTEWMYPLGAILLEDKDAYVSKFDQSPVLSGLYGQWVVSGAFMVQDKLIYLKFREIPSGRARRAALLHWVHDHWRKTRNDPDVEAYVRQHLRGSKEASYGGMRFEIQASKEDAIANLEATKERARMKTTSPRTDRRKSAARPA